MYSRILIATDGSELAGKGLAHGLALAKALGATVTVISASDPWMPIGVDTTGTSVSEYGLAEEFEKASAAAGELLLAAAAAAAAKAGVPCKTVYVSRTFAADAIIAYAEANAIELIVMASHGRRGLQRVLLGSQTAAVLAHASIPVLIVR